MTVSNQRNWKLTLGLLRAAWREYPRQRRELAAFRPGRPMFITGTHRSGTTWVAKMLAMPGLWYVHEPFNPNKGFWNESFTYAPPDSSRPEIDHIMRQILSGGLRSALNLANSDHALMPLRLFPQPFRRILIKDPLACLLTGYLSRRFDLQTLVLFRHPCGFVSSIIRLGWPTAAFVRELLQRQQLVADHLMPVRKVLEQNATQDGIGAAAALHGALNLVLWNTAQSSKLRFTQFEDLCVDPIAAFKELFGWFELDYTTEVSKEHEKLCLAEQQDINEYRAHAVQRNSRAMADSWKRHLTPDQVALIRDIWEEFGIPLYRSNDEWAIDRPAEELRDNRVIA